jgi:hypothetical protein
MSHTRRLVDLLKITPSRLVELSAKKADLCIQIAEARINVETGEVDARATAQFKDMSHAVDTATTHHAAVEKRLSAAVAAAVEALAVCQTELTTGSEIVVLRSRVEFATTARAAFVQNRVADLTEQLSTLQFKQDELDVEIDTAMANIASSYNASSEALEDTLKTASDTGTARASNLSAHPLGELMVVPGAMKTGAPTKKASEEWFRLRFGEKTYREEFASFWAHNKPRTVNVYMTDNTIAARGLASNKIVGAAATNGPTAAASPVKRKQKLTPVELKEMVWLNTMGDCNEGACVLCRDAMIYRTRRKGFEKAHVISDLNGGSATPDNMIATCSACNGVMAGQNMETWIMRNVLDAARRIELGALLARIKEPVA